MLTRETHGEKNVTSHLIHCGGVRDTHACVRAPRSRAGDKHVCARDAWRYAHITAHFNVKRTTCINARETRGKLATGTSFRTLLWRVSFVHFRKNSV